MEHRLPHRSFHWRGLEIHLFLFLRLFLFAENERHNKADNYRERDSPDRPGNTHFSTEYAPREDNRQYADRRAGIKERDCRA